MQVSTTLGRPVLEKLGVYNPYSGVTSNQSECFNSVLKRLQSWREVPVDAIVLALYHLQAFYHNEVQRGFAGLGNYSLCATFEAAKRSADELNIIPAFPPEDIVNRIRERATGSDAEQVLDQENKDQLENDAPCNTQYSRAR